MIKLPMFAHGRDPREVQVWRQLKMGIIAVSACAVTFVSAQNAANASLLNLKTKHASKPGTLELSAPKLNKGAGTPGLYTFSGKGAPGTEVHLFGLPELATVKTDKDGKWKYSQKLTSAGKIEVIAKYFEGKEKVFETPVVSFDVLAKAGAKVKLTSHSLTTLAEESGEEIAPPVVYPDDEPKNEHKKPDAPKVAVETDEHKPKSEAHGELHEKSAPKDATDDHKPKAAAHGESRAKVDPKHGAEKPKPHAGDHKAGAKGSAKAHAKPVKFAPFAISTYGNQNIVPRGVIKLGGKGKPGSKVQVYVDNVLKVKATVKPNGRWMAPVKINKPGKRKFKAVLVGTGTAKVVLLRVK